MDKISWNILRILQQDARVSYADLGKQVHLSAPAVAERIKRMEEAGIIIGFTTCIDLDAVGYPIVAHIQARVFLGKEKAFIDHVKQTPGLLSCDNVTGEKAFLMKVAVKNMKSLDRILEQFSTLSETNSMILLSTIADNIVDMPQQID